MMDSTHESGLPSSVRIATRRSRLAMWQSEHVRGLLGERFPGLVVELLPMTTQGDERLDRSLAEIGGKGLFLKELERAILDGEADFAVHSLKDVPAESPEGLALHAFLPGADPGDLWIGRDGLGPMDLPAGSRVGSSSLRRISQLRALRDDLEIVPLRGNVETRLDAVRGGRVDATILAAAGLQRLDIVPEGAVALPLERWLPAPGQGVVTVQGRADAASLAPLFAALDNATTRCRVEAERAVVAVLGGDCRMPLAAHAVERDGRLHLTARLGSRAGRLVDAGGDAPPSEAAVLGADVAR
ncbi:MAG: hydroxymethylbilane synthase, partial [Wenzhouxiangellaceae bacterium]|nr:hydroxymethylbilane synthase [Wenzhouxiangellaceae bacterium]